MTNKPPAGGQPITIDDRGVLNVPDQPVIPFIEGDGTGPDIWRTARRVFEAAVEKAYDGDRRIRWHEVLAGEKAFNLTGSWLPDETVARFQEYLVGIKGPLTTPVGGGIRSLNVALRQILDLYVCLMVHRSAQSRATSRKSGHGHLSREHGGRVRREGTRGLQRRSRPADRILQGTVRMGNPVRFGHRHQAGQRDRKQAVDQGGDRVRHHAEPEERHPGAQGQHPEIHRRRLSEMGIRARGGGVSGPAGQLGPVPGQCPGRQDPA